MNIIIAQMYFNSGTHSKGFCWIDRANNQTKLCGADPNQYNGDQILACTTKFRLVLK